MVDLTDSLRVAAENKSNLVKILVFRQDVVDHGELLATGVGLMIFKNGCSLLENFAGLGRT